MNELDVWMRDADPAAAFSEDEIDDRVRIASATARAGHSSRGPVWKRAGFLIPVVGASIILMGAAVFVPLQLSLDGQQVEIDVRLPIQYTTSGGEEISCTYGLYFGSARGRDADLEAAVETIKERDWVGIGEDVYEYAIAHSVSPQVGEVWEADSPRVREKIAFELAVRAVVTQQLTGTLPDGAGFAGTTDCSGQLS